MRWIAVVLLLLSVELLAETQEEVYFRALQAEESGDLSLAIKNFEKALSIGGEYDQEIGEILNDYYDALGIPSEKRHKPQGDFSLNSLELNNPWTFHFFGELSSVGMLYSSSNFDSEVGAELLGSFSALADYTAGSFSHSFGVNLSGEMNFGNDDMPALDTNDWKGSVGLEYNLVGKGLQLDLGLDLNFYEAESVSPSFYTWLEYDFYKKENSKAGVALWAYYDWNGPMSLAVYGSFQNKPSYGFRYSVKVGPRFEVDSTFNYLKYLNDYEMALSKAEQELESLSDYNDMEAFDYCLENYGDRCFFWDFDTVDSLYWETLYNRTYGEIDVGIFRYWTKWFGPSLRGSVQYKFRNGISLEGRLNLFYSFVLDGPDSKYEDISRFSAVCSGSFLWSIGFTELYLMVEDSYKMYNLPKAYQNLYDRHSNTLKLKLGTRWDF